MDIIELENKEILNAYALMKQIEAISHDLRTEDPELRILIDKLFSANKNDLILISKIVTENQLNLGNTKDSVAEEILKNIRDINNSEIDVAVKTKCFFTSINRLISYKIANIKNLLILLNDNKDIVKLKSCLNENKNIRRASMNQFKSIC